MGWTKIVFDGEDAPKAWHDFETAFSQLHLNADDRGEEEREVAALYSHIKPWVGLTAYLSPAASQWVAEAMPAYKLTPCDRPRAEDVSVAVGDPIAADVTYVELTPDEREEFKSNYLAEKGELAGPGREWDSRDIPTTGPANDNVHPLQRDDEHRGPPGNHPGLKGRR